MVIKKELLLKYMCMNKNLVCPEDILFTYKCLYESNDLLTVNESYYVYDKSNENTTNCQKY